jgi:transcriptional regulator of acetoin/glycerol metabolism
LLDEMAADIGTKRLSPPGLARLVAYRWPGNVRELRGVLYRAALKTKDARIGADHIDFSIPPDGKAREMTPADAHQLVAQYHGNVSAAARAAGMARTTFRAMLEKGRGPAARR